MSKDNATVSSDNDKKQSLSTMGPTNPQSCKHCNHVECVWREFASENKCLISGLRRTVESGGRAGLARKQVFQTISRKINGIMGAGNRRRLPKCVEDNVRRLFPSEDGKYMGYKEK